MKNLNVLITSGATREPIDSVRFISNLSTGQTGATLAEFFAVRGARVTYLHGVGAQMPRPQSTPTEIACAPFTDVDSLDRALKENLGAQNFDLVIHAAAVSDYRPANPLRTKISSQAPRLHLELLPTPKLLPRLRGYSRNPSVRIVGFKLTDGATLEQINQAVERIAPDSDWIAHNDLSEIRRAPAGQHPFALYQSGGARVAAPRSVRELGETLWQQQESTHAAHH